MFKVCKAIYGIFLVALISTTLASYLTQNYPASTVDEIGVEIDQLLPKYGYPFETHFVTTEDNYILRLHRMPRKNGKPVFMMHGLLDSSPTWIIMRPWDAIGYLLFDSGYDVWMGNARANRFSRNHTTLDPLKDEAFWKISWHEIGYYDLPAMIDYVLNVTGFSKLSYFGHSQGTTSFFVMASMRPEYNKKIIVMSALAPVAYSGNVHLPRMLSDLRAYLPHVRTLVQEILNLQDMTAQFCFISKRTDDQCLEVLDALFGRDRTGLNRTMWPIILGHLRGGASVYQIEHYSQLVQSKRFCQFDHGPMENMKRYGKLSPPDYPLENVTAAVALYYTHNDVLAPVKNVNRLINKLPNVVENILYPYKTWNHLSMMYGINSRKLAHFRMLEATKL